MSQIKVTVTQEDIANGIEGISDACAIAQAIMREFSTTKVRVGESVTIVDNVRYNTSTRARKFIDRFDNEKPVKPSTFIFRRRDYNVC
jgi:hypothetical protein